MDRVKALGMTATATSPLKDPKLVPSGLVESASVNSFADFIPSQFNEIHVTTSNETEKEADDFINNFICHLIFYSFFCVALVLHILIDLGLGSFLKQQFVKLTSVGKKTFFKQSPAFA